MFMYGCRIASHFYDNGGGFGRGNEECDGGGRQEDQSGGSTGELPAAVDHFTHASQSLWGFPAHCLICKAVSVLALPALNILTSQVSSHITWCM